MVTRAERGSLRNIMSQDDEVLNRILDNPEAPYNEVLLQLAEVRNPASPLMEKVIDVVIAPKLAQQSAVAADMAAEVLHDEVAKAVQDTIASKPDSSAAFAAALDDRLRKLDPEAQIKSAVPGFVSAGPRPNGVVVEAAEKTRGPRVAVAEQITPAAVSQAAGAEVRRKQREIDEAIEEERRKKVAAAIEAEKQAQTVEAAKRTEARDFDPLKVAAAVVVVAGATAVLTDGDAKGKAEPEKTNTAPSTTDGANKGVPENDNKTPAPKAVVGRVRAPQMGLGLAPAPSRSSGG